MPVENYIFEVVEDVTDVDAIGKHIENFIVENLKPAICTGAGINQASYEDVQVYSCDTHLVVYVTGLTVVTAELVRKCMLNGIPLTLMHYDVAKGEYFPQRML